MAIIRVLLAGFYTTGGRKDVPVRHYSTGIYVTEDLGAHLLPQGPRHPTTFAQVSVTSFFFVLTCAQLCNDVNRPASALALARWTQMPRSSLAMDSALKALCTQPVVLCSNYMQAFCFTF